MIYYFLSTTSCNKEVVCYFRHNLLKLCKVDPIFLNKKALQKGSVTKIFGQHIELDASRCRRCDEIDVIYFNLKILPILVSSWPFLQKKLSLMQGHHHNNCKWLAVNDLTNCYRITYLKRDNEA